MKNTKNFKFTATMDDMTLTFEGSQVIETTDESAVKLSELATRRTMAMCRTSVAVAANIKEASGNVGELFEKAEPFVSKMVEHVGSLVYIFKGAAGPDAGFEEA